MAILPDGRLHPEADRQLVVTSRLRDRRHTLGLTQKQVVTRLASLGVTCTNKSLSSLEHGTGVDVSKLPELAAALDCTITYLLGLTDDPRSWQPDVALNWRPRVERPAPPARTIVSEPVETGEPGTADTYILGPYVPEHTRRQERTTDF